MKKEKGSNLISLVKYPKISANFLFLLLITLFSTSLLGETKFTFMVIPDSQIMTQDAPSTFTNEVAWIKNNVTNLNIKFVSHVGDVVNVSNSTQYNNAKNAMKQMDGVVPYAIAAGNHDMGNDNFALFNTYFPISMFSSNSWWGGSYDSKNLATYQKFSAEGVDFIIIHFAYNPSSAMLSWADGVLKSNSTRKAIISTHNYLNTDGSRTSTGNTIWDSVVKNNANVFMVVCGHNHDANRRVDNNNFGKPVHQLLADFQSDNPQHGTVRYYTFDFTAKKINAFTYSTSTNHYRTESKNQFSLDIPFDTNTQTLRPADNPANTVNGVDYKYYQGSWSVLPNFASITPSSSSTTSNFSITSAPQSDNFGYSFTGYINVPTDGVYTFYTSSDDGSKLYIGSTLVVSNDGLHGTQELSGQIGLKAGKHAIKVEYFEGTGGQILEVRYQGSSIAKQLIPNSALYRVSATYMLLVENGSGTGSYLSGSNINITANAAPTGKTFDKWTIVSGSPMIANLNSAATILTMTASSARISATYKDVAGPVGYSLCAYEGQSYNFTSPVDVAYGANGQYAYQYNKTGTISFNNSTFGDPIPGITKYGYYKTITTLRPADNPSNTVNGLDYKYYQGSWSVLPNFTSLTPSSSGIISNFSITSAPQSDNFGYSFTGYINVPTDGLYTFYTSSDDGSKLYIGSTLVVSNDGLHGTQELSGQIGLKAGKHAIKVEYFEGTGGQVLEVRYQGSAITKQLIPSSALYRIAQSTYSLSVTSGSGSGNYASGATVNITANAAPTGKMFDKWVINSGNPTITNISATTTTLKMATTASSVSATYKTAVNHGGGVVKEATGSFVWSGTSVDYISKGGISSGDGGGTQSTPAKTGDFEIVSFGASHGGGSGLVDLYFDKNKMLNQGFKAIYVRGCEDRKSEVWIRKNNGQTTIDIPAMAKVHNFIALDGRDVQIDLNSITFATNFAGGSTYSVPQLSGSGLKLMVFFGDDPTELLNVGVGALVYQEWGFGDGDSFSNTLYAPGEALPTTVSIKNWGQGGQQYVGAVVNFNKINNDGRADLSEEDISKAVELTQNYPNPFNPVTTINFILAEESSINLVVMNSKGETVKVLASGIYQAGDHSFDFNGLGLNTGIYFYQLVTPEKTITKKMILIK